MIARLDPGPLYVTERVDRDDIRILVCILAGGSGVAQVLLYFTRHKTTCSRLIWIVLMLLLQSDIESCYKTYKRFRPQPPAVNSAVPCPYWPLCCQLQHLHILKESLLLSTCSPKNEKQALSLRLLHVIHAACRPKNQQEKTKKKTCPVDTSHLVAFSYRFSKEGRPSPRLLRGASNP